MPALANLSINDGQAAPAAHTFVAKGTNGVLARFEEQSNEPATGYFVLSHEYVRPANATAAHRVKVSINMPTLATVNGVPTIVRNSSAKVEINLSQTASLQERKDILAYIANLLDNASMKTTVTNLEPFW